MEINVLPEQIEEVREMLLRQRQRYQPKIRRRTRQEVLTDEYIINYIKKYVDSRGVRKTKYCIIKNNDINCDKSNYKIYKKFNDIDINENIKREMITGLVVFR